MAAHPLSFSLSLPSSKLLHHNTTTTITFSIKPIHLKKPTIFKKLKTFTVPIKAIQDSNQNNTSSETDQNPPPENNKITGGDDDDVALSDVGSEIKKLMKEREEKEPDFWSGVVEEIREIEWPVFGKVLSTTGVVIGVIAGSSVVLLTLNAVLAELSDQVFAGKGVQDFFG
ncbi:preprotein translocase subunit SECE1 [Lycium barbarum]|uniref:preprotein translocase subunit SECE1 n=1 Tax=Lycium barbarum TaxID=112863 RepID=UPI00293EF222|nr:preprotein translocase subunit SECE1 [Lycium barbarum]